MEGNAGGERAARQPEAARRGPAPSNDRFYAHCAAYFEYLRRRGLHDYPFEDEFYYTMPAVSGSG